MLDKARRRSGNMYWFNDTGGRRDARHREVLRGTWAPRNFSLVQVSSAFGPSLPGALFLPEDK